MNDVRPPSLLAVLLVCFDGQKRASQVRSELDKSIASSAGSVLDEVVVKVGRQGKASIYDPRRTIRGMLTSAFTWGLFGLVAGGVESLAIWAVAGAVCGGLYAYLMEHLLSKGQLQRIGHRLGSDSSALVTWAETPDAARMLSATAALRPTTASVAAIADDLTAKVSSAGGDTSGTPTGSGQGTSPSATVLSMLLLRYPGEHSAQAALKAAGKSGPQVELVFASDKSGKRRVSSPTTGVAAMSESDVVSWGGFGLVWGAIVGFAGNGGILGSIESGVVTGILWAIFGLVAGALYGLWAGRGVTAGRLKGVGPLLPPDSSAVLAWTDGAPTPTMFADLATPDATTLVVRFRPAPGGAILEV